MNRNLQILMTTCIELGTARTMEVLGVHSGEISTRKARDTYGKWFIDAVENNRLHPCRVDNGRNGTRWYRVVDILALKADDVAKAKLIY